MKQKKNFIHMVALVIVAIAALSFVSQQDQQTVKKRDVPAEYKNKVNPVKGDESLKMVGLRNYNRHCVSCHGKTGIGDGVMAKNLKSSPGNFRTADFQKYTDGEIYYLSFIGIDDRPDFLKLIPNEEDRWAVVNFVRTLKID